MLEDAAETIFRQPVLIAGMLMVLGASLRGGSKGKKQIDVENISLRTSFLIGLSQALAIISPAFRFRRDHDDGAGL